MAVGPIAGVIKIDPAFVRAAQAAPEGTDDGFASAVLQQQPAAGGGGKGGHKAGMDAIARIAAGANVKPKARVKSPAERQAEIERLKRERDARGERDLADDRPDDRKQPYEENPLLALF